MHLRASALRPSRFRRPYFDGWDITRADFETSCAGCRAPITIPFSRILRGAWGWQEEFGPEAAFAIATHFGFEAGRGALRGGWPSVSPVDCGQCGTRHVFYAEFDEYRNSVYRIVAQGLSAYAE